MDIALRDVIDDGTVIGPRLAVAGAYITSSTGGGEVTGMAPDITLPPEFRVGVANSAEEVRKKVRILIHGRADLIKAIASGAVLTSGTRPGAPVAVDGDAMANLESFQSVAFVMKNGVVYKEGGQLVGLAVAR